MKLTIHSLLLLAVFGATLPAVAYGNDALNLRANQESRQLADSYGAIFTMPQCPGRCLTADDGSIKLDDCGDMALQKYWNLIYECGGDTSFFKIESALKQNLCIADPIDCDCDPLAADIKLVNCDGPNAAWFSYGNLHKTGPNSFFLYSARCWLNEGKVAALQTPSKETKRCPTGTPFLPACTKLEWQKDDYSSDVSYYDWSYNIVKQQCDDSLFPAVPST
jgi:hypothetical protein